MIIFVFGSNLAGRHGKGAALYAKRHFEAIQGQGIGFQGRSYAIPTKGNQLEILSLSEIKNYVNEFILFARNHPNMQFMVTAIGCGLAGYTPNQIGPMFKNYPSNCELPKEFEPYV